MTAPPLRIVFWESTTNCNLRCVHCRCIDVIDERPSRELSTARALDLVDQLAALSPRPLLVLSGGEPLLRHDIHTVAAHATAAGLAVALATNATLVHRDTAARIAKDGIRRVSVSLDGADAETHDAFRSVPGSFTAALAGIAALRAAGVPLQINTTSWTGCWCCRASWERWLCTSSCWCRWAAAWRSPKTSKSAPGSTSGCCSGSTRRGKARPTCSCAPPARRTSIGWSAR